MDATGNKQLMQDIFSELSKGNSRPFVESLADDVSWTIAGTTKWSKTFQGRQAVLTDLLGPLTSQFAVPYTATAHRIIAEGDHVVTELVTAALGGPPGNFRLFSLFNPEGLSNPRGYSHVAEIGGGKLVHIAGQVSLDASGALVGENDFPAQVRRTFENVKTAVEAAGGTFADIVKLNYYCVERVNADQLPQLRQIRDSFVNVEKPPVSTLLFVSRLVRPEWLIEIEATAVVAAA